MEVLNLNLATAIIRFGAKFKAENRNAQQNKYIDPLDKERKNNSKKSNNTPGCLQSL